jgi:hypothetical protein
MNTKLPSIVFSTVADLPDAFAFSAAIAFSSSTDVGRYLITCSSTTLRP